MESVLRKVVDVIIKFRVIVPAIGESWGLDSVNTGDQESYAGFGIGLKDFQCITFKCS